MTDLRCDGVRRSGPKRGSACQSLLARVEVDDGKIEIVCGKCGKLCRWRFERIEVAR